MEKIKLFDLIEKSFLDLGKTNKKIWIIGILISIFSGGLIIQESFDYSTDSDYSYEDEIFEYEGYEDVIFGDVLSEIIYTESLGGIMLLVIIVILIFVAIMLVIGILLNVILYYLYHSIYESLFDTKLDRAPLGLVVRVNSIVALKVLGGFILFIVPGIVIGIKYAPVNYILCKYPELSSREILNETRAFSKGFKWKIFLFSSFITIISLLITSILSPSILIEGYIWIDVLNMLFTFISTVFMVVYTGLFDIRLYKDIENFKNKLSIE